MKTFRINKTYQIVCDWQKTRNGFKHVAKLKGPYFNTISETKECYLNRTWESFEFETVIKKLLKLNSDLIPKSTQTRFLNKISGNVKKEIQNKFKSIAAVAQIGNLICPNQEEKNNWKKRMLTAGLPELDIPSDWDQLSENDKETRLNNVIAELSK